MVVPPPNPTEAPDIAAPAALVTVPVMVPLPDANVMVGAAVVAPATTVTLADPFWKPVSDAVMVVAPAGRLFNAYVPSAAVVVVNPDAVTVAPESPVPLLFTTLPVTFPGLTGASCRVGAVVLWPAVTVTVVEALVYPPSAAVTVAVPAGAERLYAPSAPVIAPFPPAVTEAPCTGAPAVFVTMPVIVPVVTAVDDI